jgi:outer membrane protein TolC
MKKSIIFLFICFSTSAQTNKDLTEIVKQVLDHSPALKGQKTGLKIGDVKTQIQQSYSNPIISYEAGITRLDPVSKVTFNTGGVPSILQFQPNMNYNTNFVANQVIYDWGKNALALEKSRLENKLTQVQIDVATTQMAYQISTIYHQIKYLQNVIKIQQSELSRIKSHAEVVETQVKLGELLELDQLGINIRLKNQEIKISETELQLNKMIDFLNTQAGKDIIPWLKNNQLNKQDSNGSIEENPLLLQLNAEDAILQKEINVQEKSSSPTIAGIASIGVRNGYLPRINGEVPPISDDFKLNTALGLKLTIPIYSGKRSFLQENILKFQKDRVQLQRDETGAKLSFELRQGEANLVQLANKSAIQNQVIEQAVYAYKLAEARFTKGTIKQIELDAFQNTLEEAQLQKENIYLQISLQQLELLKIKGLKFWEL